jgi:hypothetical protein
MTATSSASFPYRGTVLWLTPEQGGRRSGPPEPRDRWPYYAATGWLPPLSAGNGLRSLVLRGFASGHWRSAAEAQWLVDVEGYPSVVSGSVLVVSEGPRPVGFFLADQVDPSAVTEPR